MGKAKVAGGKRTTRTVKAGRGRIDRRVYTLEVILFSGPVTQKFVRKNKVVSRTFQIPGDRTLDELHGAIYTAHGFDDDHLYEFHVGGKHPMDRQARQYVLPMAMETPFDGPAPAGDLTRTRLGSLGLKVGNSFWYWFDYGDDWWHQIHVTGIQEERLSGRFPRVTKRVGASPPQYPHMDGEGW